MELKTYKDRKLAPKNKTAEESNDPTNRKTVAVENNFDSSEWFSLNSATYLTTPLKVPSVDVLLNIANKLRICPIFAIPASPTVMAKRR